MTAITTTDLTNAKLDLDTIAKTAMVGTTSDTIINRDGETLYTLQGMLKKLGYQPAVTYAGSIVFGTGDITKTIDRSGIIYAPLPSVLPFTTTGTWGTDSSKFLIIQTSTDLAASQISFDATASGTGWNYVQTSLTGAFGLISNVASQTGRTYNQTDMGTFTGSILTSNTDVKTLLQELETHIESDVTKQYKYITNYGGSVNGNIAVSFSPSAVYPPVAGQVYFINYGGVGGGSNLTKLRIHASDSYRQVSKMDGSSLSPDDIRTAHLLMLMYTGTEFILLNPWNPKHDQTYIEPAGDTYAKNTTLSFTTGLGIPGARNFNLNVVLTCNTTDAGFAVGDSIVVSSDQGLSGYGCQVYVPSDGDSVCISFAASGLKVLHKTTRVATTLTDGYWDVFCNITKLF